MFKRIMFIVVLVLGMIVLTAGMANAGVFGNAVKWVSGTAIAYILTGILAIGVIGGSIMFAKIIKTLQELGEFLTSLGLALSDKKITKEELTDLLSQGKDVVNVWKKTPDEFKVKG